MIRRVHVNHYGYPGPGESVVRVPTTQYRSLGPDTCVKIAKGVAVLPNPRCAVINLPTGLVTNVINADDSLDVPPNAITTKFFNHATVQTGWKWDGTTVNPPPPPPTMPTAQYDWPVPVQSTNTFYYQEWINY
jgi:hypothetical protein